MSNAYGYSVEKKRGIKCVSLVPFLSSKCHTSKFYKLTLYNVGAFKTNRKKKTIVTI